MITRFLLNAFSQLLSFQSHTPELDEPPCPFGEIFLRPRYDIGREVAKVRLGDQSRSLSLGYISIERERYLDCTLYYTCPAISAKTPALPRETSIEQK